MTSIFRNQNVLITGHTGFKGAWLSQWLLRLGANLFGCSLEPPTSISLYDQLQLRTKMKSAHADVRDANVLRREVVSFRPRFIFHLAAQSLVRRSYREPVDTFATNVMGTVNLLESIRELQDPCAVVIVTTDKCYLNREWNRGYREDDTLGGADPYSASKAMAELAVESYRRSWFPAHESPVRLASARAGNVIGGGDWAEDRIIPDCVRALQLGQPIAIRNPNARRPWQHVLDPLFGYLLLAERLWLADAGDDSHRVCSAFNFGPDETEHRTVEVLVDEVLRHWPGTSQVIKQPNALHEATLLSLATNKAKTILGWQPRWRFDRSIQQTIAWYQRVNAGEPADSVTDEQIDQFEQDGQTR
ncbi:MAG: CDP-glucose 4,6-dehydratase [Planctomycetota bacterium]